MRRFGGRTAGLGFPSCPANGRWACKNPGENVILRGMRRVLGWCMLAFVASGLSGEAQAETGAATAPAVVSGSNAQPKIVSATPTEVVTPTLPSFETTLRPPPRRPALPSTRWEHKKGHAGWTRAALSALKGHGKPLVDLVPADIGNWCPAYPQASDADRRAFWVGFLSALAKHESTYRATAVGGNGRWYGLLQILPGTARGYKCNVGTGRALKDGAANLSCAIRIMAVTVPRDGVIYGRGGRGVAADWGPMRSKSKRRDMSGWLREQSYCQSRSTLRPKPRPTGAKP